MNYQLNRVEGYPDKEISKLSKLFKNVHGDDFVPFDLQLRNKNKILSCFAYIDSEMVGFKIGFESRPKYFESWVGGVDPEYRRMGIARALMRMQHEWCQDSGFIIITTTCLGDNQSMLIANLKSGFNICGTYLDRQTHLKVVLQKTVKRTRNDT